MANESDKPVEPNDLEEHYANVRSKAWPSQRDYLWTSLLGDLEEPLNGRPVVEAKELLRTLEAQGFL